MFGQLPTELVLDIFLRAAEDNIHDNRRCVVQLALVSRSVYWLVHPVLYRIMVISDDNCDSVYELAGDTQKYHIFAAVRSLHVSWSIFRHSRLPPALLFTAPTLHLDASPDVIAILAPSLGSRLVSLRTQYMSWHRSTPIIRTLRSLTHLTLDVRSQLIRPIEDQARDLFSKLPNITHFAFEFVDDFYIMGMLNIQDFEDFLRVALARRKTVRVALRFRGKSLADWPAFRTMLGGIDDPRVAVWLTLDLRHVFVSRDAWLGKNVWTEAKVLAEL